MAIRQSPILRVCLLVALAAALADAASLRGAKEIEEAVSIDEKETSEDFYQMIIDEPFEEEAEDKEPSLYEKYVEPLFTTHEAPEEGERDLQQLLLNPVTPGGARVNEFGNFAAPRAGFGNNGFINQPVVNQPVSFRNNGGFIGPRQFFRPPVVSQPVVSRNWLGGRMNWSTWNNNWDNLGAQSVAYRPTNYRAAYGGDYWDGIGPRTAPIQPVGYPNFAQRAGAYNFVPGPAAYAGVGGGGVGGGSPWIDNYLSF